MWLFSNHDKHTSLSTHRYQCRVYHTAFLSDFEGGPAPGPGFRVCADCTFVVLAESAPVVRSPKLLRFPPVKNIIQQHHLLTLRFTGKIFKKRTTRNADGSLPTRSTCKQHTHRQFVFADTCTKRWSVQQLVPGQSVKEVMEKGSLLSKTQFTRFVSLGVTVVLDGFLFVLTYGSAAGRKIVYKFPKATSIHPSIHPIHP